MNFWCLIKEKAKRMKEMEELTSCKTAIENCKTSGTFAIAHLYKEEKAMDMHIHDCYEIYYSICGGKQFLIDNCFYTIAPGDLFIINQYESHKLTQIDNSVHERIVLSVAPDFMKLISTKETDLSFCFTHRSAPFSHKLSLNKEQQKLTEKVSGLQENLETLKTQTAEILPPKPTIKDMMKNIFKRKEKETL